MAYGSKDPAKGKDKGKDSNGSGKSGQPKRRDDLPILIPARSPKREGQSR